VRIELASASAGETERIAAALAARLEIGDVVTVAGELGAGGSMLPPARVAVTLELARADQRRITLAAPDEALLQGIA